MQIGLYHQLLIRNCLYLKNILKNLERSYGILSLIDFTEKNKQIFFMEILKKYNLILMNN